MNTQTRAVIATPSGAATAAWLRGAGIVLAGNLLVAIAPTSRSRFRSLLCR